MATGLAGHFVAMACNNAWATGCNSVGIFSTGPLCQTSLLSFMVLNINLFRGDIHPDNQYGNEIHYKYYEPTLNYFTGNSYPWKN